MTEKDTKNISVTERCLGLPTCTCGKCIIKRKKEDHFAQMPYSNNLSSMYQNDFKWKNPTVFKTDYLKATHSAQENACKKNISGCLLSNTKISYKPFKVSTEGIEPKTVKVESVPFYGSTTYENTYINFGSTRLAKGIPKDDKEFKVAFRGKTNYGIDYREHPKEDYMKTNKYIYYKPTLEFVGKLTGETEFKDNYKPVDFNQPAYFGGNKLKKGDFYKSQMIPAPFPKSNFESNMKTSYVDHFKEKCKLAEYLKSIGKTSLEI